MFVSPLAIPVELVGVSLVVEVEVCVMNAVGEEDELGSRVVCVEAVVVVGCGVVVG